MASWLELVSGSERLSAGDDAQEQHDDRNDKEDVNETADGVAAHQPEEPEYYEYDCDGV